jgi:protein-S-isoprenylcysteine O-methyltransferase Ste14
MTALATLSTTWGRLPLPAEHAIGMVAGLLLQRREHPSLLVTGGPQARTRNPMYVGWILLHVGVGLLARSPWVLATWPVSFALVHRSVLREERGLAQRFGREFTEYRTQVPRYVGLPGRGT